MYNISVIKQFFRNYTPDPSLPEQGTPTQTPSRNPHTNVSWIRIWPLPFNIPVSFAIKLFREKMSATQTAVLNWSLKMLSRGLESPWKVFAFLWPTCWNPVCEFRYLSSNRVIEEIVLKLLFFSRMAPMMLCWISKCLDDKKS